MLRYLLKARGIKSDIIDIMMCGWRLSTIKSYNIYIKRYIDFCDKEKIDCTKRDIKHILKFLNMLYKNNCGYSVINIARSALSALFFDPPVGEDPLIIRFMKGIYNIRPSRPRYSKIWNVADVLLFLQKWTPSRELDLKTLTLKTILLVMLTSGQRCQTIHALSIKQCEIKSNNITFNVTKMLKHNNIKNRLNVISFDAFSENKKICVVTYLKEYMKRTKPFRNENNEQLFLSWKTHKPISKDTLSRYIKNGLKIAGINTDIYKAHSTRAASTSAAQKTIDIASILKAASWRNAQTFAKYYSKPIERTASFTKAVLQSKQ